MQSSQEHDFAGSLSVVRKSILFLVSHGSGRTFADVAAAKPFSFHEAVRASFSAATGNNETRRSQIISCQQLATDA
jgi:hypothetical protein